MLSRLMKKGTCHAECSEARRGGLFLIENKQKQIPLPRLRDRDDIDEAFFISLLDEFDTELRKKRPCDC
jgi:hypothetical protein